MIVLLLCLAAFGAMALIGSSMSSISQVTPTDTASRGRWGVLKWEWQRNRRLDAHERRWQTSLISAREQSTRWPDLVAEVARLERAAELTPDPEPPTEHDAGWVDSRLTALEQHLETLAGDST